MKSSFLSLLPLCGLLLSGCGTSEPVRFRLNMEGRDRSEITREQEQMLVDGLTAAFGTPDEPFVFPETGLDINKLKLAAGPSMSTQTGTRHGLYRQHCAHCHGISGDGYGPTAAFLNPYPRDYRKGIFKFTSTEDGAKATRADLKRTILEGIPGTAMPSFALLPDDEVEALVEYVKYLSLRGETEELLFDLVVNQGQTDPLTRDLVVNDTMMPAVNMWNDAENKIKHPPARPENLGPIDAPTKESLELGRRLFTDAVKGQCIKCHGPTGLGDGGDLLYDAWNEPKEQLLKAGREEEIAEKFSLPIQQLKPRNLRLGIYRGGRRPVDLYRRVFAGIKGAKMPALGATETKPGLSNEEIWAVVDYVRSLPYDETGREPPHPAHTAHLRTN
jgi:mono/diheme cytochrome c family protein